MRSKRKGISWAQASLPVPVLGGSGGGVGETSTGEAWSSTSAAGFSHSSWLLPRAPPH